MKTLPLKLAVSSLLFELMIGQLPLHAQWTGSGAGGAGTDFNDTANWTGGNTTGNFTNNTCAATIQLTTATTTLTGLNFGWSTNGNTLAINGNGTGDNEVLALTGDVTLPATATQSVVTLGSDVTLDFGAFSTSRTFTTGGAVSGKLIINGLLTGMAGSGGKIQIGSTGAGGAVVVLNNNGNTFDAPISIFGNLYFSSIGNVGGGASALGAPTTAANGTITMSANGASFHYTGSTNQTTDRAIIAGGNSNIYHDGMSGILTLNGDLTLSGVLAFNTPNANATTKPIIVVNGKLTSSGNRDVNFSGTGYGGILELNNVANGYTGKTTVSTGVLVVTKLANGGMASSIGASSNAATNLVIGNSGQDNTTLRYVGAGDSTDRLFSSASYQNKGGTIESSGSGALRFTNTGTAGNAQASISPFTWQLGGTNADDNLMAVVFADSTGGAVVSLTKKDSGSWRLSGNSTYTGVTTVAAGKLIVSGTLSGTQNVTVAGGAELNVSGQINAASLASVSGVLSGAGRVGKVTVQSGGTISPGNSPGTLTADALTLLGGGNYRFELKTDGAAGGAGTEWDTIAATTLDLSSLSASSRFTLKLVTLDLGGLPGGLDEWDGNSAHLWRSVLTFSNLIGSFDSSLFNLDASGFTGDFTNGTFTVVRNGNALDIEYAVVPEPSAWVTLAGGIGALALGLRRRAGNKNQGTPAGSTASGRR